MNVRSDIAAARPVGRPWAGRVEDDPLVRGRGGFVDDRSEAGAVAACFVRSPHAAADIISVDTSAALAMPGVVAVLTGHDLAAAGLVTIGGSVPMKGRGGSDPVSPLRPALAAERVAHVGEGVALVLAETREQAADAADAVAVEYTPRASVTDLAAAVQPGAPQIWAQASGNIALDWSAPPDQDGANRAEIDRLFAEAAFIARAHLINQRLIVAAMEPRAATASYDPAADRYTLRCGSQSVSAIRGQIIGPMKLRPDQLRVISEDVGGGFGMKGSSYPEYVTLLHAARVIGRPVRWVATRGESFLTDNQARDSVWDAELALDRDGRFLALRVKGVGTPGAYVSGIALVVPSAHVANCLPSVYDVPRGSVDVRLTFTNTVPTGPYRGAGRPEANYLLERLIDIAAAQSGIDRVELRRRNLVSPEALPYVTPFGQTYDSGNFPAIFEMAVTLADYAGFPARRAEAEARGAKRGIGIGCYLEFAGVYPEEPAAIAFPGNGRVEVTIAPTPGGQGHLTVFRAVAAERLGVPEECVTVLYGDSSREVNGIGCVGSRSATMTGGAVANTADAILAKAKPIAALLLQAREAELDYRDGAFVVGETARRITLLNLAQRAEELKRQGVIAEALDTRGGVKAPNTYPNGCHIAEIEIDPETGLVEIVSYVAVDDCGRILNPVIVEGQIHGGIAQGLGQALSEAALYDPDSGQLLSGTFMDYAVPRATAMPDNLKVVHIEVPCTTNPLGTKGTGEAGTTAAPPALMNAIADALGDAGRDLQMPATPQAIWRALNGHSG